MISLLNLLSVSIMMAYIATTCFSQTTSTLRGKIDGVDVRSNVYLNQTSKSDVVDSFLIMSDTFQFQLPIEENDVYFLTYKRNNERFDYPVYLQKGSDVQIHFFNDQQVEFSGSYIAEE